ncbi:vanin-like protein 3 isoform X2 [Diabrotica virgifera virgifera]|uniref:CN hydrolase domain-containing protein n=1 Tax=Diabrotica virgifera virgifera TaxID=50390 RepID=A0ABM5KST3_DIAVI|nr:vanin-like protein 3 isoform X2 [Diabrotica virgifera virgifera]
MIVITKMNLKTFQIWAWFNILIIPTITFASVTNYTAAIVEYHPDSLNHSWSVDERVMWRAKNHIRILDNITEDLEIILFPEKSLYYMEDVSLSSTVIPKISETICNSSESRVKEYLKLFSCAAIRKNTSIAINVIEQDNCTSNGACESPIYYNTVVIFDNNGRLSGRYRKWNLFGEYQLSKPKEMDITTIRTKHNVTFGIFNCFDIIFNQPSLNLTRDLKLKNILFPNHWISELPYLTGEKGPVETILIGENGGTKFLVKTVPNLKTEDNFELDIVEDKDIDDLAIKLDHFFLLRDLSMDDHTSILMKEDQSNIIEQVCNGEDVKICCNFNITIVVNETAKIRNYYRYHMAAFNGIRSFSGIRNASIEACGLVACLNESLSSCARRFPNYTEISWPITFKSIVVEANFTLDESRIQYPNSLLSNLKPILPQYTSWEKRESKESIIRRHSLHKNESRLLSFGVFGRDFNRDDPQDKHSNRSEMLSGSLLVILGLYLVNRLSIN